MLWLGVLLTLYKNNMSQKNTFLEFLIINSGCNLNDKKERDLRLRLLDRKCSLNKTFYFSTENISKLEKLNKILKTKEDLIFKQCCRIEEEIFKNNEKQETPFTDYEIDVSLSYFSSSVMKAYEIYNNDITDLICESNYALTFRKKENERLCLVKSNWLYFNRDFGSSLEFNRFQFKDITRSFYELIENSYLALDDIIQIDKIWWDIEVLYQYCEEFEL